MVNYALIFHNLIIQISLKGGYNILDALFRMIAEHTDSGIVNDFMRVFDMLFTLIGIVLIGLVILYIIKWIIFMIYCKTTNETIQSAVNSVIYELDELADNMSNKEKKRLAVNTVKDLFIWRAIPVPTCIIGIIIDLEVAAIRKLQKNIAHEKDPYLHPDDEVSKDTPIIEERSIDPMERK